MVVSVCPVANVAAPVEDVWELLAQPSNYDKWWDAHFERSVPEGPATPGQISYATTKALGKKWDVTFVVKSVNPDTPDTARCDSSFWDYRPCYYHIYTCRCCIQSFTIWVRLHPPSRMDGLAY